MIAVAQLGRPIDARDVFAEERSQLVDLLLALRNEEWGQATICPGWTVRDITAHLLHDDLRRLSRTRDNYAAGLTSVDREALPAALNQANEAWVSETRFLSPSLLVDLLSFTSKLLQSMWASIDLSALGEGVWWAGVQSAPVWLDLARDYSEDWAHQQQIRDATNRGGLTTPKFIDPLVETFLQALPHTYRQVPVVPEARVLVTIRDSDRQLHWTLVADPLRRWSLKHGHLGGEPSARVIIPFDTFWRLATGGIPKDRAAQMVQLHGDLKLAEPVLDIVSIIR